MAARPYLFPLGSRFGEDNLILLASAKRHVVSDLPGPTSIKTVMKGSVVWHVEGRGHSVDSDSFLVLAEGERYSMNIDEPAPVTTCCAFFQHAYVERVAHDAATPVEAALDSTDREPPPLVFLSRLHSARENSILRSVQALGPECAKALQPSAHEEDFLALARDLVQLYEEVNAQISRVPAARASTRAELFRRMQTAKEYLHGHSGSGASLEAAARAAALSPYHFHRAFQQVHGETPHQWLTAVRLGRAYELLRNGRGVLETCVEIGFSSASSFARLFRSRYGVTPSAVRGRR